MTDDRKSTDDELKRRIDEELDEALEGTFPASDPIEPPMGAERRKADRA